MSRKEPRIKSRDPGFLSDDLFADWHKINTDPAPKGVLCEVFFPLGVTFSVEEGGDRRYAGPIALAFLREEGWVRADVPTLLSFEPAYWRQYDMRARGYR